MGLFDFLSKKPSPKRIDKLTKRMMDEHHQQPVRQEAMDELVSIGTPEAIAALIKRLGTNFRDTIKNEQEKKFVSDTLAEHFRDRSIEPLLAFIRTDQTISAAIRTVARLIGRERLIGELCEVLASYPPKDHRTISARMQLVDALADYDDPRIIPALLPYANDHDDDVRVKVMDLLEARVKKGHPQYDATIEALVQVLQDPEAAGRITRRAASVLVALKADLSKHTDALAELLPDGFALGADGRLAAS
ncbi:MAG: HEAT repeat domain-containing protein [Myxococcales bacterium]|nr:HEAT repeat domain-containing protein [Myxococcales bacterium]